MMAEPDLFPDTAGYPYQPGARDRETSRAAAAAIAPKVSDLHERVIACIRAHGPLTADEIAEKLGRDKLAIRPRCSELAKQCRIRDTGLCRRNASRLRATVWGLPDGR